MQQPRCNQHSLIINQICGQPQCCLIMCHSCFNSHHLTTMHSTPVIMDEQSITFFIHFSQFLSNKMNEWVTIAQRGFTEIFKNIGGNEMHLSSKNLQEITKQSLDTILFYKNLIASNKNYVLEHKDNFQHLLNPVFLKDIYNLIKYPWKRSSEYLNNHLRDKLVQKYPHRYSYQSIMFEIQGSLIAQVQETRVKMLEEMAKRNNDLLSPFGSQVAPKEQSEHNTTKQINTMSSQVRIVQSFYEILNQSDSEISNNFINLVLQKQEGIIDLLPNFLSHDALQKQLEELLLENQAIKQENYKLRCENNELKVENASLKRIHFNNYHL